MASYKDVVDYLSRHSGLGNLTEAFYNTFYGINHRGIGNPVPYNADSHGLTFFTRPRLNLSYDNIAQDRVLTPMLTSDEKSYQRAIRVMLDPDGAWGRTTLKSGSLSELTSQQLVTSPLVDNKSAFLNILTNNLLSLNGWPDPTVGTFNSREGIMRESWSMVDDTARYMGTFDLTANFRNIAGDPITLLFHAWIRYMSNVYLGHMMPYPDMVLQNEIDYQTRIYRLVLSADRKYVTKIAACGAAFPTSSALGAAFDFTADVPIIQNNASQISIPFHCVGVEYNDPILIKEFNTIVQIFNPDMMDDARPRTMRKIPREYLNYFNYYGYPQINLKNYELEWWVSNEDFNKMITDNAIPDTAPQYADPTVVPNGN